MSNPSTKSAENPELLLQALYAVSHDAVVTITLDGTISSWSPAAEKVYGYSSAEAIGQSISMLVPSESRDRLGESLARLARGETMEEKDARWLRRGGMEIPVSLTMAPIKTADGSIAGACVLTHDASEQKHVEDAFRKLNREIVRADEAWHRLESELKVAKDAAASAEHVRDNFVANMNHEIRTALASILGYAEMMYDAKQTVTERLNCIGRIRQNAKSLTELVEDILDLSKVESGTLELKLVKMPLVATLEDILSMLQSQAWKKRLSLNYTYDGQIPESITSDPRRLRQILLNIIGNAIKFTDRGAVNVFVKLEAPKEPGGRPLLRMEVRDTGCGIAPDQRECLFSPFLQGDISMTRMHSGTGLGLSLARQIARALGGDVELSDTQPGRGSTFTITIDPGSTEGVPTLVSPTHADIHERTGAAPLRLNHKRLEGMRILVVEDSRDIQILISHFLKRSGAHVEVAENGAEGIKKAKQGRYDLILMDIQMPVLSGYEATAQIHNGGIKSPVVALTAHAMKGVREKCLEVGCADFLTKPINANALLELVQRYYQPSGQPRG